MSASNRSILFISFVLMPLLLQKNVHTSVYKHNAISLNVSCLIIRYWLPITRHNADDNIMQLLTTDERVTDQQIRLKINRWIRCTCFLRDQPASDKYELAIHSALFVIRSYVNSNHCCTNFYSFYSASLFKRIVFCSFLCCYDVEYYIHDRWQTFGKKLAEIN